MNVRETPRALARAVEWEFAQSTYAPVLAEVPPALFPYWTQTAHRAFPAIARDVSFYAQAAEGLMMFFDCASAAAEPCALPSRAADSVWHAWLGMDAAGLEGFCLRLFGRAIAHGAAGDMGRALAVCLVQARRRVSQPAAGPHLPRLFSLDARLGMPRGFGYRMLGGAVACSALDEFGNLEDGVHFPPALAPRALRQAGLVSQAEYGAAASPPHPVAQAGWLASGTDDGGWEGDGAASRGSACAAGAG